MTVLKANQADVLIDGQGANTFYGAFDPNEFLTRRNRDLNAFSRDVIVGDRLSREPEGPGRCAN